jgi:hypothetical protein
MTVLKFSVYLLKDMQSDLREESCESSYFKIGAVQC